jgi:hypothetical protein
MITAAKTAYAENHAKAFALVEEISGKLSNMPAPDNGATRITWEHVGSVSHVIELLEGVSAFLGNP